MKLRPYQVHAVTAARHEIALDNAPVCICIPTGGGKTPTTCEIVQLAVAKRNGVLICAHRKELIEQMSRKLDRFGVGHGIIMADHPRWRPHELVQVASVQTLTGRIKQGTQPKNVRLIVFDECQHVRSASYMQIIATYPDAVVIGATATPERADGKGLGEVFNSIVQTTSVRELIQQGYLVPPEGFSYDMPDLRGVKKRGGDYNLEMVEKRMEPTILGGSIIKDYLAHSSGRRALCFAVNVKHSNMLVEQARAAGITAEHVDAKTPMDKREALLGPGGRLEKGDVMFVSNVGVATEGTDIPAIETIILARPTSSLGLALQMMGRGLRTWCFDCSETPKEDGSCEAMGHRLKTSCRIHDHAGILMAPHIGPPDEDRVWTLDPDPPKRDAIPTMRTCDECCATFRATMDVCPRCGWVVPETERGVVTKEIREDETRKRMSLDEIRAQRAAVGLRELPDAELKKVLKANRTEKAAEFLRLQQVAAAKMFKPGFVMHNFRETFGHWPRFKDAELADVTPATKPFLPLPKRDRTGNHGDE